MYVHVCNVSVLCVRYACVICVLCVWYVFAVCDLCVLFMCVMYLCYAYICVLLVCDVCCLCVWCACVFCLCVWYVLKHVHVHVCVLFSQWFLPERGFYLSHHFNFTYFETTKMFSPSALFQFSVFYRSLSVIVLPRKDKIIAQGKMLGNKI